MHGVFQDHDYQVMALAKGEDVGLWPWFEKGHVHSAVANVATLTNELVHATVVELTVSLFVHIDASRAAGRPAVKGHAEWNLLVRPFREHEVDIACVESHGNAPATFVQDDTLWFDRPVSRQSPLIES